mmetsp:Transcript_26938/g.80766  ORF Transcript_26938/g.80766 Transcript_26938/m.80766 type:complete len:277 (-) Transcript_26938:47-877(-)
MISGPSLIENASPALVGDAIFSVLLFISLAYGVAVIAHFRGIYDLTGVLSKDFDANGFCVTETKSLGNSHLWCVFGDAALAAALFYLVKQKAGGRKELLVVAGQTASIVSHGFGHGVFFFSMGDLSRDLPLVNADTPIFGQIGFRLSSLVFFWGILKRTSFPFALRVGQTLVYSYVITTLVPLICVFGTVSIMIYGNLHSDKLIYGLAGEKDEFYALYAATQILPLVTMIAEPLACDSLVQRLGGHILFDYSIPAAFIAYLLIGEKWPARAKAKAA